MNFRVNSRNIKGATTCCIRSNSSQFYLHPFREGNTRSQFVFFGRLAQQAGWEVDAASFEDGAPLREPFIAARFEAQRTGSSDALCKVLDRAIVPVQN